MGNVPRPKNPKGYAPQEFAWGDLFAVDEARKFEVCGIGSGLMREVSRSYLS
jgi:hypothetical protein